MLRSNVERESAETRANHVTLVSRQDSLLDSFPELNITYGDYRGCTPCESASPSDFGCESPLTRDCFCNNSFPTSCCEISIYATSTVTKLDEWIAETCPDRPKANFLGLPSCARSCADTFLDELCPERTTDCLCHRLAGVAKNQPISYQRDNDTLEACLVNAGDCNQQYGRSTAFLVLKQFRDEICEQGNIPTSELDTTSTVLQDPFFGYCWLPSGSVVSSNIGRSCLPPKIQLGLLAVFNISAIIATIFLGRRRVRNWFRIGSSPQMKGLNSKSEKAEEGEARAATVMTRAQSIRQTARFLVDPICQAGLAAATAALLRTDGFNVSFTKLMFLWFARPRANWLSIFLHLVPEQYVEAGMEEVLTEHVMNALSVPIIVMILKQGKNLPRKTNSFLGTRNSLHSPNQQLNLCQQDWERFRFYDLEDSTWFSGLAESNLFSITCAFLALALSGLVIFAPLYQRSKDKFWQRFTASLFFTFHCVATCAISYVFWDAFLKIAQDGYCPGKTATGISSMLWCLCPFVSHILRGILSDEPTPAAPPSTLGVDTSGDVPLKNATSVGLEDLSRDV